MGLKQGGNLVDELDLGLSTKLKFLSLRGDILLEVNFKLNQPALNFRSNAWCLFSTKDLMGHNILSREKDANLKRENDSMKNKTIFTFPSHTQLGADCHRNGLCCAEESCSSGHFHFLISCGLLGPQL